MEQSSSSNNSSYYLKNRETILQKRRVNNKNLSCEEKEKIRKYQREYHKYRYIPRERVKKEKPVKPIHKAVKDNTSDVICYFK